MKNITLEKLILQEKVFYLTRMDSYHKQKLKQMKKAKESGFDGFLGKPLDPDRFPDQIRRILNGEPVWEFS